MAGLWEGDRRVIRQPAIRQHNTVRERLKLRRVLEAARSVLRVLDREPQNRPAADAAAVLRLRQAIDDAEIAMGTEER